MASTHSRWQWLSRVALVMIALVTLGGLAAARPGGGHSFSGGGGHSYSGGGHSYSGGGSYYSGGGYSSGDGGEIVGLLFVAIFICVIAYFVTRTSKLRNPDWDSGPPAELDQPAVAVTAPAELDPAFSRVGFEDFAFRLFSSAHRARHSADASAALAPYVSAEARAELSLRPPLSEPVQQVVVGALRVFMSDTQDAGTPSARVRLGIEYEANLATAAHTYYSVERWIYSRAADARSKPPGRDRTFLCPNCGAPWQASQTRTQVCASCGQTVDNGRFDWHVEDVALMSSDERPPTLTTETAEQGTDLPTYSEPQIDAMWSQLLQDDPAVTTAGVEARLALIYATLNAAWSSNDLGPVRGMVSDGLFDYLQYWVDAYRQQSLRNVLENMRITQVVFAKLVRDPYFDALTLRVYGAGLDYTIREPGGKHVIGSRSRDRVYSEYWTLIRSAGRKGAPHATPTCGNCGAPLQITQSGECEHCGAHVTSGEFDWVLSKIEQDDTYRG